MKVIDSLAEQRITERLTVMAIQVATKEATVQDVQRFVQKTIEVVDEELEGLCRPHDWVRRLGNEAVMTCARCGEDTVRDFRLVPPVKVDIGSLNPAIQAIDDVLKTSFGIIHGRKKEPGEETRL